ncbi:MAG: thioredoxin family protein [Bacteroidales bacterium]|nr:thioredoxin family protein [Bacteroidales bacterium]MBD5229776.1 thioredoxin family protein [Bacteroidales bacterium]MBD5235250.1 thioredoxin family protein [Barnesiella sp.]MBD5246706.1 thioredoxin family protein [Barnesiella sp.]MBD5258556.1 thioredoxin family protein [Barnesiella sp.]
MTVAEELQNALNGAKPVLVEFYADWCPHCKAMMPIVAELKKETADKAVVVQIEGDENADIMNKYHVRSYPTWILFKDGQEAWRDSGEKPLSELKDMINRFA